MHSKGLLHKPNEIIPSLNIKIHSLGGSYDQFRGVLYLGDGIVRYHTCSSFFAEVIQIHAHLRTTPEQWLLNPVG